MGERGVREREKSRATGRKKPSLVDRFRGRKTTPGRLLFGGGKTVGEGREIVHGLPSYRLRKWHGPGSFIKKGS